VHNLSKALQRGLQISVVLSLLALIIVFARKNIRGVEEAILAETALAMQQTVRITSFLIERVLEEVTHASTGIEIKHDMVFSPILEAGGGVEGKEKMAFLRGFYEAHKEFVTRIRLFDAEGKALGAYPPDGGVLYRKKRKEIIKDEKGRRIVVLPLTIGMNSAEGCNLLAEVSADKINELVQGLSEQEGKPLFLLTKTGQIISHPRAGHLGQNMLTVHKEEFPDHERCEMEDYLRDMMSGTKGSGVYWSRGQRKKGEKPKLMILAFHPVRLPGKTWSVGLSEDYEQVIEPVKEYSRNLFLVTEFLVIMIIAGGTTIYRFHKKRDELEITAKTTEMLSQANDQLMEEVGERKRTQQELKRANDELQSAQTQILQAEKMAAIGQLSAGVAHEIKNPLAIIILSAQALLERFKD